MLFDSAVIELRSILLGETRSDFLAFDDFKKDIGSFPIRNSNGDSVF